MANCYVLLNDGSSFVLLNDGTSRVQLNICPDVSAGGGGGSGVGRSTQKGVSIYDVDQSIPPKKHLFPEWRFEMAASLTKPMETRWEGIVRFAKPIKSKPFKIRLEQFMIKESVMGAGARFRMPIYKELYMQSKFAINESIINVKAKWSYRKIIATLESYIRAIDDKRLARLEKLLPEAETQIINPDDPIKSFSFEEDHKAWRILTERDITAFTHSSTWIGQVIYDSDSQQLMIMMSGKRYLFCGVPDRVYDSFEGSPSKGEFYWRNIKDRYNC
jgi:hypothetical protein